MEKSSEIYMKIWNYCKKAANADFSGVGGKIENEILRTKRTVLSDQGSR